MESAIIFRCETVPEIHKVEEESSRVSPLNNYAAPTHIRHQEAAETVRESSPPCLSLKLLGTFWECPVPFAAEDTEEIQHGVHGPVVMQSTMGEPRSPLLRTSGGAGKVIMIILIPTDVWQGLPEGGSPQDLGSERTLQLPILSRLEPRIQQKEKQGKYKFLLTRKRYCPEPSPIPSPCERGPHRSYASHLCLPSTFHGHASQPPALAPASVRLQA